MKPLISLQLWSVQDSCSEDFEQTLENVKKFGYDGVEFAGYYERKASDLKQTLDNLSLKVSGSHLGFEGLRDNFEEVVAFEKGIGNKSLIVPYIAAETLEDWEERIAEMKLISDKLQAEDLVLGYHNHAHEVTEIPNVNILEKMIELIPDIQLEIDTYWLNFAGVDVIPWLNKHQKNISWLHLKDMRIDGDDRESTEISSGVLPIAEYLAWAKQADLEWVVIEQEAFQKYQPIESAELNIKALKKLN